MYLGRVGISMLRHWCIDATRSEYLIRTLLELVLELADLQVLLLKLDLILRPQIPVLLIQLVHALGHFRL